MIGASSIAALTGHHEFKSKELPEMFADLIYQNDEGQRRKDAKVRITQKSQRHKA